MKRFALLSLVLFTSPVFAADRFVTTTGAGTKDGSSYENAFDGSNDGLQACWDALQPGETCYVGSGIYHNQRLAILAGGEKGRPKTLMGQRDDDGKRPLFIGDWSKEEANKGKPFIYLETGQDHIRVEGFRIKGYQFGVRSSDAGRNDFIELFDLDIRDVRVGVELFGDARCGGGPPGGENCPEPLEASRIIRIKYVRVTGCTKMGIRLRYGVYDAEIRNCTVDMGGKAYDTDPDKTSVGFSLGDGTNANIDSPDRDILYVDCVARGAYNDHGDGYWQGDGFKSEDHSTGVRYIRCKAFDNTDAGFDLKGPGSMLEDCIAARNKRNYRLWNPKETPEGRITLRRCLGHHAKYWGDRNSIANVHLFGDATIEHSTFHNTMDAPEGVAAYIIEQSNMYHPEPFTTMVKNSIYSCDARTSPQTLLLKTGDNGETKNFIHEENSSGWDGRLGAKNDPGYLKPEPLFEGPGTDFDNAAYGAERGYYFAEKT